MVAWAEIRGVNASKAASVEVLKSILGRIAVMLKRNGWRKRFD